MLARTVVAAGDTPAPPAPVEVHRAAGPIVVDGDLSDEGWRNATVIDQFYETSPGDNTLPRVRTVAFLTYDERYFYVGVRADDPQPSRIRAPFVERDGVVPTDDYIAVFLDSRNDRRSAIELRVNPRGIQGDAIFNDANANEDFSPDFFYDTGARITTTGWNAEFRIPFSTLRYSDADPQSWGILIRRNYPRDSTYTIDSAPVQRESTCLICYANAIEGLSGLPKSWHAIAAPYVTLQQLAQPVNDPGSPLRTRPMHAESGGDAKWSPTADHAIDLTANPDFSQIESDVAQITVNERFALMYPEKRPFFLEGFDLFDTPIQVAYTRTITSPSWGIRGTGKLGSSAYTLLIARDRGGGSVILPGPTTSSTAPQDFHSIALIGRVRRDIGMSFVGAVLTDREIAGGGHNRVFGPDFQWRPTKGRTLTGQLLFSDSLERAGQKLRSSAVVVDWTHVTQTFDYETMVKDIGTAFRADNGFLPQVGYREFGGNFGLRLYPASGLFYFVRPFVSDDVKTDQRGSIVFQRRYLGVYLKGKRGLIAGFSMRPHERNRVGNALLGQSYATWSVEVDPSRRVPQIIFSGQTGESIDFTGGRVGRGSTIAIDATLRLWDRLTLNLRGDQRQLEIHSSRLFIARVERLKAVYSFSQRSLIRAIGQYTSTDSDQSSGSFNGSLLYSFRLNWQTVFYLGYGDARVLSDRNDLVRSARSTFLKISYALQR